jgi:hypothetical protein
MPPSRASMDASKSTLYAMIIFVVLFLIAAVIAVMMYIKNSEYVRDKEAADKKFNEMANASEYNQVKSLIKPGQTAVGQLGKQMRELGGLIGGAEYSQPQTDLVGLVDSINKRLEKVWEQIQLTLTSKEESDKSAGLAKCAESLIQQTQMWAEKYMQADQTLENQKQLYEQQLKAKDDLMVKVNVDLEKAALSAKTNKENYDQLLASQGNKYEQLISELKQQVTDSTQLQKKLTDENTSMNSELSEAKKQILELKNLLVQYRPLPDTEMAALEPDGFVVSVSAADKLAYINLAKNDHIYRGLTFSVYDSYQSIPKTGQGKGTLEVIDIMDTISKCRIVKFDPTNPVMEHDVIANLVWDKNRKYNFCAAGEFDFDKNSRYSPEDRAKVVSLIEGWGGVVSNTLSVDTDFLVLGNPPALPPKPPDEFDESAAEAVNAYRQAVKHRDEYEEIRKNAAALGVPTFNLSRFLYFIGYK